MSAFPDATNEQRVEALLHDIAQAIKASKANDSIVLNVMVRVSAERIFATGDPDVLEIFCDEVLPLSDHLSFDE